MKIIINISILLLGFICDSQSQGFIWKQNYGGDNAEEEISQISQFDNFSYLITGMSNSNGGNGDIIQSYGHEDGILMNIDLTGGINWIKNYGNYEEEAFTASVKDASGKIYAVGYSSGAGGMVSMGYGLKDVWVVKTNGVGTVIWEKSFGGTLDEAAYSVQLTPDGSLLVAAVTYSNNGLVNDHSAGTNRDIWILRLDGTNGNIIWKKCFGGVGDDGDNISAGNLSRRSVSMTTVSDSVYMITAISTSVSPTGDIWVFKIDIDGNLIQENYFGGSLPDVSHSILKTSDGNYLITGASRSIDGDISDHRGSSSFYDGWVFKIDENLNLLWSKSLGGTAYDICYNAAETNLHYYVVGLSESVDFDCPQNYGDWDMMAYYIDDTGNLLWSKNFGSNKMDEAKAIHISTTGNPIIAGFVGAANNDVTSMYSLIRDMWMFEYAAYNDIEENQNLNPIINCFPNPANQIINFELSNYTFDHKFDIDIFDFTGRYLNTFTVDKTSFQLNVEDWKSGCYMFTIRQQGEKSISGKFIVNKN